MDSRPFLLASATLLALAASASCTGQQYYKPISVAEFEKERGWYDFGEFRYRGSLRNGKPDGLGELVYPARGIWVNGGFHQGRAHGMARILVRGLGTLDGHVGAGVLTKGKAELENGDVYAGSFSNWRFHGQGMLIKRNDVRYQGAFAAGLPNGLGMSYDPATGTLIEATFRNGAPNGAGLIERSNAVTAAHFKNGQDVTEQERHDRAAAPVLKRAENELHAKQQAEYAQSEEAKKWRETAHGLQESVSPSGIRKFRQECGCWYKLEIVDGRWEVYEQVCLPLISGNLSVDEQREVQRVFSEKARACHRWQEDIADPTIGDQIDRLWERHEQAMAQLAELRRAREEAAAALQRTKELARLRQHAEVQQRTAQFKAEEDRLARARMADLRQRCNLRPCYCPVLLKTTPKNAVSCQ